ncbi:MAG: electron-transfer flavoprotein:ubiquinone oxidoreductase, partial [Kiritimatiellae bacterium]|nr:electron-transfer flavoprotein:ubiquinone oxidoreductase [Kiritimatiellia bacterium]
MSHETQRDILDVDVVCVGAGIASLSTAHQFLKRAAAEPESEPPTVLILEKGLYPGAHILSGAVVDSEPLKRLLSEDEFNALPFYDSVRSEKFAYLTPRHALNLPLTPPPMKALGLPIASLSDLTRHLAELCEAHGAEVYSEMPVASLLEKEGRIIGVRLGDKGVDKEGHPKSNFEPGADVHAHMVILGEGAQGVLTSQLIEQQGLDAGTNEQAYAIGLKEVFEIPAAPERVGHIMHTFGYPLPQDMYGGGFLYCLDATHVAVGLVIALDYRRPEINPHELFRAYKAHPRINAFLTAGKPVSYGAKILPEGGLYALPRLITEGAMIVGDAAGLLDAVRLKGAHLAVESGLAAGNALYACLENNDWSCTQAAAYPEALQKSPGWKKMRQYRNARQWFDWGLLPGMAAIGAAFFTAGILPPGLKAKAQDHPVQPAGKKKPVALPTLERHVEKSHRLDILSDLYLSGTEHEEDQPCHLIINNPEICRDCIELYQAPCTRFCPAQVYELPEGTERITIQPANCLHCKTCQIKCAMQNIEWKLPEGGGGPRYKNM